MTRAPRKPTASPAAHRAADRLGMAALALGVAELIAPHSLARLVGNGDPRRVRLCGVREIATGAGILAARDPRPWVWARVAGDALDVATLLRRGDGARRGSKAAIAVTAGALALDAACAWRLGRARNGVQRPVDYSHRSGFPRPPAEMRGAGRRPARHPAAEEWEMAQR